MSLRAGIRVLTLFLAAVVLLTPVFSQGKGAGVSASGGSLIVNLNWRISGHVTLEDGNIPPQPIVIQSVCSGNTRNEATADTKGGFGFTLGKGSGDNIMNAANVSAVNGTGAVVNPMECVIQATLSGYSSDIIYLVNHDEHSPDVGTIVLHKNGEGRADSPTSKEAPKAARKAFDQAVEAAKAKKFDQAAKDYQTAVTLYPAYAEAWCQLGQVQMALKQLEEARKSFNASIQADGHYLTPYTQLAALESATHNWKTVVDVTDRALKLAPAGYPALYLVNAMANYQLHNAEAAEKSARTGIQIDRQNQAPRLYEVLASVLLVRNDYAGAAHQLRTYLQVTPLAEDAVTVRAQIADLEAKSGGAGK